MDGFGKILAIDNMTSPHRWTPPSMGSFWDGLVMDWDDDGDPDIYVCNDFGFLYGGNWVLINDGTGQWRKVMH